MSSLINGAAFFNSTSVIIIGRDPLPFNPLQKISAGHNRRFQLIAFFIHHPEFEIQNLLRYTKDACRLEEKHIIIQGVKYVIIGQ